MILIGILALSVVLIGVAARTMPPGARSRVDLTIAAMPLLLTVVVPLPFAMASLRPDDWLRQAAVAVSRAGVALSFVLLAIGALLTVQAVMSGDRRSAILFALETILAGLPAGIVSLYAAAFRL